MSQSLAQKTKTVQVQVAISPIQTSVTLLDQPINIIGLPDAFAAQISPQTVDVIISGPLPVLDALTPQDITVTIDVTGLDVGPHQLNPKLETDRLKTYWKDQYCLAQWK